MRKYYAYAHLVVTSSGLEIVGQGQIEGDFTRQLVHALFALPTALDLYSASPCLLPSDVLRQLSEDSLRSFAETVEADPKLKSTYEDLKKNFAVYAFPALGRWPPLDNLLVLEALPIDLPFVMSIVWLLDGTLRIISNYNNAELVQTEAEFLSATGKTLQVYCQSHIPSNIERYNRALELLGRAKPTRAKVTFINQDSQVDNKTIVYWQSDQIDQYLRRRDLSHIATDPE